MDLTLYEYVDAFDDRTRAAVCGSIIPPCTMTMIILHYCGHPSFDADKIHWL